MDPDRAKKERTAPSFLVSPRVPQSGAQNGKFSLHLRPSIRSRGSLPPDSTGGGTLSENEKAPPPPPEFSPVTIGSLARGTNSGLHDAGPFLPPSPYGDPTVFLDPSCDLPSPPLFSYSSFQLQAWIAVAWCPFRSVDSRIAHVFNPVERKMEFLFVVIYLFFF